jgi:hypothetical protein
VSKRSCSVGGRVIVSDLVVEDSSVKCTRLERREAFMLRVLGNSGRFSFFRIVRL